MRRALRIAAIALAGVAFLAALVAWRLSYGAITLDPLAPYLGAALTARGNGVRVDVGGAALAWDAVAHRPEVEATRVRVVGRNGETLATLPVLHVALSLPALLRGEIVPSRVTLLRPRVRITVRPDGGLAIGVATEGMATDDGDAALSAAAWPPELAVHATEAELVLVDQLAGEEARATSVDLDFMGGAEGRSVTLAGDVVLDGNVIPVRVGASYAPDLTRGNVTLTFRRLDPAVLGGVVSRLAARRDARWLADIAVGLSRVRMPLDGQVRVATEGAFRPTGGRARVRGASGTLSIPEVHRDELAVTRLGVVARSRPDGSFEIGRLALDLDGARLRVAGRMQGSAIDMRATVKHFATERLARYWPDHLGTEARRWVMANISRGQIRSGDAHVLGTVSPRPRAGFVPSAISGSFVFDGLSVRYQASMPPATGVAGAGKFDGKRLDVRASRGVVGKLELAHARATIPPAGRDAPRAEVEAALRGPLAEALALLRRAPGGQATAPGIDPETVSGTAAAEFLVRVPRASRPPELEVSARIDDVAVPRIVRGWSLSDGNFTLDVDARELRLEGHGRLEGVPLALLWTDQRGSGRLRRVVDIRGRIDAAGRAAVGFDLLPWVAGPIDLKARYEGDQGQVATLDVRADLQDAVLAVPVVSALAKDAGTRGDAHARLELRDGSVRAVRELEVRVADSRVSGRASRSPDGASWQEIEGEARLVAPTSAGRAGTCSLTMKPAQSGYGFRLTSDDAGTLLERLSFGGNASGGKLVFAGTADLAAPGHPLDGRLDVRDVTVLRAPVLARVATLASVTALRDALAGKNGIRFRQVEAGIRHRDASVTIADGLASGPSLGVTLRGTIDRNAGIADLAGTLIPSYAGLNTAPSRIPVIGTLVTGGGEASVAVDFTVRGPLADPSISVDPVSALTPGALRELVRRLRR